MVASLLEVGVTMYAVAERSGVSAGRANDARRNNEAAQQRDEADEAEHIGASQLIPGVRPLLAASRLTGTGWSGSLLP